jgi:hypothetical protein
MSGDCVIAPFESRKEGKVDPVSVGMSEVGIVCLGALMEECCLAFGVKVQDRLDLRSEDDKSACKSGCGARRRHLLSH